MYVRYVRITIAVVLQYSIVLGLYGEYHSHGHINDACFLSVPFVAIRDGVAALPCATHSQDEINVVSADSGPSHQDGGLPVAGQMDHDIGIESREASGGCPLHSTDRTGCGVDIKSKESSGGRPLFEADQTGRGVDIKSIKSSGGCPLFVADQTSHGLNINSNESSDGCPYLYLINPAMVWT